MAIRTLINRQVGRLLGHSGAAIALLTRNRIRSHGVVVDASSPLITDATRASLFWGYYEGAERRAAMAWLRPELPVIEVGASIGFLSALIAKRIAPAYQVAVEANPALLPVLQANLRANGASQVKVVAAAIAYGAERVTFAAVTDTASGRLAIDAAQGQSTQQSSVPATTLGELLRDAPPGPFALVCDIEGAEYDVFAHEDAAVRGRCALAVMELHEVTRDGVHYSREQLGAWLCAQWKMKTLFSDGKVWVLGR